ncbi:MAG: GNAT family N-acetyltransferase [Candidatus Micrarchaeota archaeon]
MGGRGKVGYVELTEETRDMFIDLLKDYNISEKDANLLLSNKNEKVIIQTYGGKPCGYAQLHRSETGNKKLNEVEWIYIDPEFRRKGFSRKLYKKLIEVSGKTPLIANPANGKRAKRAYNNLLEMQMSRSRKKEMQKAKATLIRGTDSPKIVFEAPLRSKWRKR